MLVRQMVGRFAGQIVDLPYAVATSCLAVGTALPVTEGEARGQQAPSQPAASAPTVNPVQAVLDMASDPSVRFLTFKSAAAKILGSDMPSKKDDIVAALEKRLA